MQQAIAYKDQPGTWDPAGLPSETWPEWFDRHSRVIFITPAVVLILMFAIFPTIASIVIALSRIKFSAGGFQIRFVWFQNFYKQFFANEQVHFLGRIESLSILGWIFSIAAIAAVVWWLIGYARKEFTVVGFVGRLISAALGIGIALVFSATFLSGHLWERSATRCSMCSSAVWSSS